MLPGAPGNAKTGRRARELRRRFRRARPETPTPARERPATPSRVPGGAGACFGVPGDVEKRAGVARRAGTGACVPGRAGPDFGAPENPRARQNAHTPPREETYGG